MTAIALRACAEIIAGILPWKAPVARCNLARCGAVNCGGHTYRDGVYAGMLPVILKEGNITAALTELPGGPADPRQVYDVAFDNPSMTLHIVGDDLVRMDMIAELVLKLDRSSHITTQYGEVNGIRINPASMTVRKDRPRYDVQLLIEMEIARS